MKIALWNDEHYIKLEKNRTHLSGLLDSCIIANALIEIALMSECPVRNL